MRYWLLKNCALVQTAGLVHWPQFSSGHAESIELDEHQLFVEIGPETRPFSSQKPQAGAIRAIIGCSALYGDLEVEFLQFNGWLVHRRNALKVINMKRTDGCPPITAAHS